MSNCYSKIVIQCIAILFRLLAKTKMDSHIFVCCGYIYSHVRLRLNSLRDSELQVDHAECPKQCDVADAYSQVA